VATWRTVRSVALALPEAEEGTSYRQPAFRVRGKVFAAMSPHEDGALVVRVDPDERPLLIATRPDVLYVTAHYEAYPRLLVRLAAADPGELEERITDSWLLAAPPRLAATLERRS
jgi:hypothetical protein